MGVSGGVMSPARVKAIIIEPRALVREGLVRLLEGLSYDVICTVESVTDIVGPKFIEDEQKLVLMSGWVSACTLSAVTELRRMWSDSKIVLLFEEHSSTDFRPAASELDGCAPLFVPKDMLVKLIDIIVSGDTRVFVLPRKQDSYIRVSSLEDHPIAAVQRSPDGGRQTADGENEDGRVDGERAVDGALLGAGRKASRMRLSDRERQILDSLIKGHSNKLIARSCEITEATVKVHMKSILRKIQVGNRTQAAIWALANGYSTDDVKARLIQAAEEE
jgi:two-component system nitrate/nitrite response regulator NarL